MNLQNLQTVTKGKQTNCPLSSVKAKVELCIKDNCYAFIPSSNKCFYVIAANLGLSIIRKGNRTDSETELPDYDFQTLFREHYDRVFKIAYRMLRNYDWAEDMVQEVFMRAYLSVSIVDTDTPLAAWLYRVTTNLCLDEIRRNKSVHIEPYADFDVEEIHRKFKNCQPVSPDIVFGEKESMTAIDRILRILPPHYCQVLLMKCVDELSYEDIAFAMDTTVAGVRSMIFRARKQFIKLYAGLIGHAGSGSSSSN